MLNALYYFVCNILIIQTVHLSFIEMMFILKNVSLAVKVVVFGVWCQSQKIQTGKVLLAILHILCSKYCIACMSDNLFIIPAWGKTFLVSALTDSEKCEKRADVLIWSNLSQKGWDFHE